jgi:ATP-dependent RNA helicase RhlE
MLFAELGLSAPVMRALQDEGYSVPTPIQAKAIPAALSGRDVLGSAQTGTGKTAAFALPIIDRLMSMPVDKTRRGPVLPRALILSPTRELAVQIGESLITYGRHTPLRHTVIYGGVSQFHQERSLRAGVDTIVATPGRLMDLMQQGLVNLTAVQVFVLDEADRMLDMGFIDPIRRIAAALAKPPARQTLLFSATMPKAIQHLAEALMSNPVRVAVAPVSSAAPLIEQTVYMVERPHKQGLLNHLMNAGKVERAVVFTKTKYGADAVCRKLNGAGIISEAIHGDKAQNQRRRALERFKSGQSRVLVATDVAARGLDVDGITHVFNYDIPHEPESYVHRIGRTGRAGATGLAIALCDRSERGNLRDIERLTGKRLEIRDVPEEARALAVAMAQQAHGAGEQRSQRAEEQIDPRDRKHAARSSHSAAMPPAHGHGHGHGHAGKRPRQAEGAHAGQGGHDARAGHSGGHSGGHPGGYGPRRSGGKTGPGGGRGGPGGRGMNSWSKRRGR